MRIRHLQRAMGRWVPHLLATDRWMHSFRRLPAMDPWVHSLLRLQATGLWSTAAVVCGLRGPCGPGAAPPARMVPATKPPLGAATARTIGVATAHATATVATCACTATAAAAAAARGATLRHPSGSVGRRRDRRRIRRRRRCPCRCPRRAWTLRRGSGPFWRGNPSWWGPALCKTPNPSKSGPAAASSPLLPRALAMTRAAPVAAAAAAAGAPPKSTARPRVVAAAAASWPLGGRRTSGASKAGFWSWMEDGAASCSTWIPSARNSILSLSSLLLSLQCCRGRALSRRSIPSSTRCWASTRQATAWSSRGPWSRLPENVRAHWRTRAEHQRTK
mmetsp:Transcript_154930/g.496523  ORF Transcript_154930/g.496523 Transcript_154930/m.496523 type:complete len:333 (-) Transcript_154930:8-1006(-)